MTRPRPDHSQAASDFADWINGRQPSKASPEAEQSAQATEETPGDVFARWFANYGNTEN